MNFHNITKCDLKNGEGIRVVLWVSGCEHKCKGCHNPQTWDYNSGIEFDILAKEEIYTELKKDYIDGITLSGGDPLAPKNRKYILEFIKEIKDMFPKKTIWCYTGYKYKDIKDIEHMKYIDVVVDGMFVEELSTPSPEWRGSKNQIIHYLK